MYFKQKTAAALAAVMTLWTGMSAFAAARTDISPDASPPNTVADTVYKNMFGFTITDSLASTSEKTYDHQNHYYEDIQSDTRYSLTIGTEITAGESVSGKNGIYYFLQNQDGVNLLKNGAYHQGSLASHSTEKSNFRADTYTVYGNDKTVVNAKDTTRILINLHNRDFAAGTTTKMGYTLEANGYKVTINDGTVITSGATERTDIKDTSYQEQGYYAEKNANVTFTVPDGTIPSVTVGGVKTAAVLSNDGTYTITADAPVVISTISSEDIAVTTREDISADADSPDSVGGNVYDTMLGFTVTTGSSSEKAYDYQNHYFYNMKADTRYSLTIGTEITSGKTYSGKNGIYYFLQSQDGSQLLKNGAYHQGSLVTYTAGGTNYRADTYNIYGNDKAVVSHTDVTGVRINLHNRDFEAGSTTRAGFSFVETGYKVTTSGGANVISGTAARADITDTLSQEGGFYANKGAEVSFTVPYGKTPFVSIGGETIPVTPSSDGIYTVTATAPIVIKAIAPEWETKVDSIRTGRGDESRGTLRFLASVSDSNGYDISNGEYGFVFVNFEPDTVFNDYMGKKGLSLFTGEVGDRIRYTKEALAPSGLTENKTFYLDITDIPISASKIGFYAVPYVTLENGTIIYGPPFTAGEFKWSTE